jgi:hypothetical protein
MAVPLSAHQVRLLRQRAQRLDAPEPDAAAGAAQVARVVHALCGVQAQYEMAAALAIRARTAGLVAADVERERVDARSVVRTWCQRSTLHLLAADDLCWLLPLVRPVFTWASRRRLALGLDAETAARGLRALRAALAEHGPLTRAELVEHLRRRGLRLEGQAAPHLLAYAALQGVVCCGPDRRGTPTYALLDDWRPGWTHRGRERSRAHEFRKPYGQMRTKPSGDRKASAARRGSGGPRPAQSPLGENAGRHRSKGSSSNKPSTMGAAGAGAARRTKSQGGMP